MNTRKCTTRTDLRTRLPTAIGPTPPRRSALEYGFSLGRARFCLVPRGLVGS